MEGEGGQGRGREEGDCWANDVQGRLKSRINEGKGWVYDGRVGHGKESKGREGRVWEWRGGREGVNQPPKHLKMSSTAYENKMR